MRTILIALALTASIPAYAYIDFACVARCELKGYPRNACELVCDTDFRDKQRQQRGSVQDEGMQQLIQPSQSVVDMLSGQRR